jgi:hypothetical protein
MPYEKRIVCDYESWETIAERVKVPSPQSRDSENFSALSAVEGYIESTYCCVQARFLAMETKKLFYCNGVIRAMSSFELTLK